MTPRQQERLELHQKLNKWENSLPDSHAYDEDRAKIAKLRKQLNEEAMAEERAKEQERLKNEFINPNTGKPESFSERVTRIKVEKGLMLSDEALAELKKSKPLTQEEKRALKAKERQAEEERKKPTRDDIVAACVQHGQYKANDNDLKHAFPKMISVIGGNTFNIHINNKEFKEWLAVNGLTFTLPDFVFVKKPSNS